MEPINLTIGGVEHPSPTTLPTIAISFPEGPDNFVMNTNVSYEKFVNGDLSEDETETIGEVTKLAVMRYIHETLNIK